MKRTMFILQLTIAIAMFEGLNFSQNKHMYEDETVSVITTHGEVVGKHAKVAITSQNSTTDVYVQVFQGIPFAQPPIGKLRFRSPIEPEPWVEKLLALKPSKSCLQSGILNVTTMSLDTSEDCLYLNVWVPLPVQKDAAVMVWIYGGGFTMGATTLYNFERFAATEGIIVVSMNYRVNSLGFLYFGDEDCPGNMGLKDQELALKWVRNNIDRFGGDPEKVTIFGQSAGSMSASYHLLNWDSQKLFKRAILQSGPPSGPFFSDDRNEALKKSLKLAKGVGCGNPSTIKSTLKCLRKVDGNLLVQASASLGDILSLYHLPVVDYQMVFERPSQTVRAVKGKEVMLGFTSHDCAFIVNIIMMAKNIFPKDIFNEFIKIYLGDVSDDTLRSVRYYYEDHCNVTKEFREETATTRLGTDLLFMCSTQDLAQELAKSGIRTFMYQWTHRPLSSQFPVWVEADHGAEVTFLLGYEATLKNLAEVKLSRRMMRYWASFAKHGNPNVENDDDNFDATIEPWPVYTLAKKDRLDIGLSSVQAFGDIQEDQCRFWKHDYPLISGKSRIKN